MFIKVGSRLFCFRKLPKPAMMASTSNLMYWMRSYFPLRSSVVFPKPRVVLELKDVWAAFAGNHHWRGSRTISTAALRTGRLTINAAFF
jgi:hypothetical protein